MPCHTLRKILPNIPKKSDLYEELFYNVFKKKITHLRANRRKKIIIQGYTKSKGGYRSPWLTHSLPTNGLPSKLPKSSKWPRNWRANFRSIKATRLSSQAPCLRAIFPNYCAIKCPPPISCNLQSRHRSLVPVLTSLLAASDFCCMRSVALTGLQLCSSHIADFSINLRMHRGWGENRIILNEEDGREGKERSEDQKEGRREGRKKKKEKRAREKRQVGEKKWKKYTYKTELKWKRKKKKIW